MMAGTLITLILGIILAINQVGSIKLITAFYKDKVKPQD